MRQFVLGLLFVLSMCAVTSAQEKAPSPPSQEDEIATLKQVIVDLVEMQDRQNKLFNQEIADSRHQEAQLREECAALKAKMQQMDMEHAEQRLSDALSRKMGLCDDAIADIDRKLTATRTASVGPLGIRKQRAYVVTGTERTKLVARRDDLQKQRTEAMAQFMTRILAKIQHTMYSSPKSYSVLGL